MNSTWEYDFAALQNFSDEQLMGAVKAINACRIAMRESGEHKVSLDQIIETMYRTGLDMQSRYKELRSAGWRH